MGISNELEGEQKRSGGDDRDDIGVPDIQMKLMEKIVDGNPNKPIVLVIINGSPVSIPWAQDNIPAIIEAWYGGQEAGTAIADVIFGNYSPAGRMPITVPYSTKDLPDFKDYSMNSRTYRYLEKEPLYPFGYGLSFVDFEYSDLKVDKASITTESEDGIMVSVKAKNSGSMSADEVVQLYIKDVEASVKVPSHFLKGVERVSIHPNETKTIHFELSLRDFALIDNEGKCKLEPGKFLLYVGGIQPDARSKQLSNKNILSAEIDITGTTQVLAY